LAIFSAFGEPGFPAGLRSFFLSFLTFAPCIPAAYFLAGIGLGALFRPLCKDIPEPRTVEAGLGLAAMLSLSHALGVLGLLDGMMGGLIAWLPITAGLSIGAWDFWRHARAAKPRLRVAPPPWVMYATIPPIALMVVAASSPPGYLWDSEFGGYDALSYHLQLPQEWLSSGRIWPVKHNVYSFLPGYMEAAFTHLGACIPQFDPDSTAVQSSPLSVAPGGLLRGSGWLLLACQYLHVYFTIFAAWATGRAARAVINHIAPVSVSQPPSAARAIAPWAAGALFLATPWSAVVGSLAYNEMAMLALFACAILPALALHRDSTSTSTARIAIVTAILIGGACSAKPTALLFCGVPIALLLLATAPLKRLPNLVIVGACAFILILLPWLTRNYFASTAPGQTADPVFPFAASLFHSDGGIAHWSARQLATFNAAHRFGGSTLDALRLIVLPDANDPMGKTHRGVFHPQWFAFFPVILASSLFVTLRPPRHRVLAALVIGLCAQLALWLVATHIQSRFLLPMLVPGCILFAIAIARLRPIPANGAIVLTVGAQLAACAVVFSHQRSGNPNFMIPLGPAFRTGELDRHQLARQSPQDIQEALQSASPEQFINLALEPDALVHLIAGATPLYITRATRYNTTWDSWPDLDSLAAESRAASQPHYVLVNYAELRRLTRSHTTPPDFTEERLNAWLQRKTAMVRAWREIGVMLARVNGAADTDSRTKPAHTLPEKAPKP